MTDLLSAAVRYAERGWPCFPVGTNKKPLTKHGFKDATTDSEALARMPWDHAAGVAIATGPAKLLVLDVDPPGGENSLASVTARYGALPPTYTVTTPRGGTHYYFHVDSSVPSSASRVGPNLDVRAEGGYVVAPPSVGPNGTPYRVALDEDVAPAPGWLVALALANRAKPANGTAAPIPDAIPEGKRNATLASLAGSMRRRGMSKPAILAGLAEENRRRCLPPLEDGEVESIAESVGRYTPARAMKSAQSDADAERFTDAGNAGRLIERHGANLLYCYPWRKWLAWDGRRWRSDAQGRVESLTKETARAIFDEAKRARDTFDGKKLADHAVRSLAQARLAAMIDLARCEVEVTPESLDTDPLSLNVLNGTVDLRTGDLRPLAARIC